MIGGQGHIRKNTEQTASFILFSLQTSVPTYSFLLATSILFFSLPLSWYYFIWLYLVLFFVGTNSYLLFSEQCTPSCMYFPLGPCVKCGYRDFREWMTIFYELWISFRLRQQDRRLIHIITTALDYRHYQQPIHGFIKLLLSLRYNKRYFNFHHMQWLSVLETLFTKFHFRCQIYWSFVKPIYYHLILSITVWIVY